MNSTISIMEKYQSLWRRPMGDARTLIIIFYSPAAAIWPNVTDLQEPDMFKPRSPLSSTARRAGWQGFI